MTNSTLPDSNSIYRQTFHKMLADNGVTDVHGIELLRLVHMVTNTYENVVGTGGSGEKLSAPRWRLLIRLLLEEQAGGSYVHPTQLSKAQAVSKNTISAHLRALEEQGLIVRELDPEDRRQFRICLSDVGRTLIHNSTPKYMLYLNKLTTDLTGVEVEQLQALLWKLHGSLIRHGGLNEQCRQARAYDQAPEQADSKAKD